MKKYKIMVLAIFTMLFCSFAFASIPSFNISNLEGRYSCKIGDRFSRAFYSIKNTPKNIEFHIDNIDHIFSFNKSALQRFINSSSYNQRGSSSIFRAIDALEYDKKGRTEIFSYELLYNSTSQEHWINSFTLLSKSGSVFSRDIEFSCAMISKE